MAKRGRPPVIACAPEERNRAAALSVAYRLRYGLSQRGLARMLGFSPAAIHKLEHADRDAPSRAVHRLLTLDLETAPGQG